MDDDDFLSFGDEEEFEEVKLVCSRCRTEIDKLQRRDGDYAYCKKCKMIVNVVRDDEFVKKDESSYGYRILSKTKDKLAIEVDYYDKNFGLILLTIAMFTFVTGSLINFSLVSFFLYGITIASTIIGVINLLDKIIITVDKNYLTVESKPLPSYIKRKVYPLKDLYQIFVKEVRLETRHNSRSFATDEELSRYTLSLKYNNRAEYEILPTYREASYLPDLEKIIEDFLGIEDKKLLNEYKYKD